MALLQCEVHVEYVPSAANPADIPSRSPRGRTQKQEILEAVQVDQPSNQRLFQIPSIGHLQDAQAARTAIANLCSVWLCASDGTRTIPGFARQGYRL